MLNLTQIIYEYTVRLDVNSENKTDIVNSSRPPHTYHTAAPAISCGTLLSNALSAIRSSLKSTSGPNATRRQTVCPNECVNFGGYVGLTRANRNIDDQGDKIEGTNAPDQTGLRSMFQISGVKQPLTTCVPTDFTQTIYPDGHSLIPAIP